MSTRHNLHEGIVYYDSQDEQKHRDEYRHQWAAAFGRSQGGRKYRLAKRIVRHSFIGMKWLAAVVAIGPRFTRGMNNNFATGAEFAVAGEYYTLFANLAPIARNLHFSLL
jgi:hypothetical protein